MKSIKIIAFVGSERKKHTYTAVQYFLHKIEEHMENYIISSEVIRLHEYQIYTCRGCKVCFDKGEEFCPLKDDIGVLIQKIRRSDGIIFASPVYAFQVSGLMKNFIDRSAYLFHRPCLFGKTFTCLTAQGTFGGKAVLKYLSFIGDALGCHVVKGRVIKSLEPMSSKLIQKNHHRITQLSQAYAKRLKNPSLQSPTLMKVIIFRLSRTSMNLMLNDKYKDYRYYQQQGWFNSAYYYPTKLGLFKRTCGFLADKLGKTMAKNN